MHKIWLIARREYLDKVRTKAFLVTTILFPALLYGLAVLPARLMTQKKGGTHHVVIVTSKQSEGEQVRDRLNDHNNSGLAFAAEISTDTSEANRAALRGRVDRNEIDGFLWADDGSIAVDKAQYVGRETSDMIEMADYQRALTRVVEKDRLAAAGLKDQDLDQLLKPVEVEAVRFEGGKESHGTSAMFILGIVCAVLIYTTVLIYGIQVMRSVLEEKSSRIVEVMLASASAKELMAGKILGVAAAGLTQLAIWAVAGSVYGVPILAAQAGGSFSIPLRAYIGLPVFFLFGFLIYAAMYAALAAAVNTDQEAQQMQMIFLVPLMMTMALMYQIMRAPNAPLSVFLSIFPLTSPVLMYLRIVVSQPPAWQVAASIGVLLATFYGIVVVCARIYRVGILMYGKRPTLPEIMKWLRYA
ncbi:MAG TPA: ABC transporter permease [Terriglobales bacterium]|nr:ABC transporter permease [Terriglobales bacterium]